MTNYLSSIRPQRPLTSQNEKICVIFRVLEDQQTMSCTLLIMLCKLEKL